jgi:hypothetical protein
MAMIFVYFDIVNYFKVYNCFDFVFLKRKKNKCIILKWVTKILIFKIKKPTCYKYRGDHKLHPLKHSLKRNGFFILTEPK